MPLYFDTYSKKFCLESNPNTELICPDIVENTRKTGKEASPMICGDGKYELQIDAFFDSKDKQRNYIRAKVIIDGVLMLPISQYNPSKAKLLPEHNINYFENWYHKGPYTIAQGAYRRSYPMSSERLFSQICDICNETDAWVNNETSTLIDKFKYYVNNKKDAWKNPNRLASFLFLINRYEKFFPIYRLCGNTIRDCCMRTLQYGMDLIQLQQIDKRLMKKRIEEYDIIWQYVKRWCMEENK